MKNKIITLSLALLCSMAFKAYSMEKPEKYNNVDEMTDSDSDIETPKFEDMNIDQIMEWMQEDVGDVLRKTTSKKALEESLILESPNFIYGDKEPNYKNYSLLMAAVALNDYRQAEVLLKKGADLSYEGDIEVAFGEGKTKNRFSAFDLAVSLDKDKMAQLLMKNGFDINKEGPQGFPLRLAYGKCLRLLLENGADVNKLNSQNGLPPLFDAIVSGWNLNIHICGEAWFDKIKLLCEKGANVNFQDKDGRTVAFHLIEEFCPTLLKYLYQHGLDLTRADKNGVTPLQFAQSKYNFHKKRYDKGMADIKSNLAHYIKEQRKRSRYVTKQQKKAFLAKDKKSKDFEDTQGVLEDLEEIIGLLSKCDIDFNKKQKILSISAPYDEEVFNIPHERDLPGCKNAQKIKELSQALMIDAKGRDLTPYIKTRAPEMSEFIEYLKHGSQYAYNPIKKSKNSL